MENQDTQQTVAGMEVADKELAKEEKDEEKEKAEKVSPSLKVLREIKAKTSVPIAARWVTGEQTVARKEEEHTVDKFTKWTWMKIKKNRDRTRRESPRKKRRKANNTPFWTKMLKKTGSGT